MLKTSRAIINSTIWLNMKSLRMNFMQYFMMVILYPLTYLIISMVSSSNTITVYYSTGMLISMIISIFINMQAMLIARSNNTAIIEMYAVFQIKPLQAHVGQSLFHAILALPVFGIAIILVLLQGYTISIIKLAIWCLLALLFFSVLSIFLGGMIHNPNLAMPIISMIYMIIVMVTPIYNNVAIMNKTTKLFYSINPISHVVSLLYWGIGMQTIVNPIISLVIMVLIVTILAILCRFRWKDPKAIEKLSLFN